MGLAGHRRHQPAIIQATFLSKSLSRKYIPRLSRIRKMASSATAQTMELAQVRTSISPRPPPTHTPRRRANVTT